MDSNDLNVLQEEFSEKIKKIISIANFGRKKTAIIIGNTKKNGDDFVAAKNQFLPLYLTPIREFKEIVFFSLITYQENNFIMDSFLKLIVDYKINYIFIDSEFKTVNPTYIDHFTKYFNDKKNISKNNNHLDHYPYFKINAFKGNDLTIEATDLLLTQLHLNNPNWALGKKIAIVGAGNLGSKLALKFVEKGAEMRIYRRDFSKAQTIATAFNSILPSFTPSKVIAYSTIEESIQDADILIGCTPGIPVITPSMLHLLTPHSILIDGGKGSFHAQAIFQAYEMNLPIYRIDINYALEGMITNLLNIKDNIYEIVGRNKVLDLSLISGGLLGKYGEIVVDNYLRPKFIYGICDGQGDFLRDLTAEQKESLARLKTYLEQKPFHPEPL